MMFRAQQQNADFVGFSIRDEPVVCVKSVVAFGQNFYRFIDAGYGGESDSGRTGIAGLVVA